MVRIGRYRYVSDRSLLLVHVHKVYHRSEKGYIKAKCSLFHKQYGYFYETKTYKLYDHMIDHWEKVYDIKLGGEDK